MKHSCSRFTLVVTVAGAWLLKANNSRLEGVPLLQASTGRIVLQLTSSETRVAGLHYIEVGPGNGQAECVGFLAASWAAAFKVDNTSGKLHEENMGHSFHKLLAESVTSWP